MKYDEIVTLWNSDCIIDRANLSLAAIKIPQLHNKYFKLFSVERLNYKRHEESLKEIKRVKWEYYQGTLDINVIIENGWDQWQKKLLRTDIPLYVDADKDIINKKMQLAAAFEKVDLIESIIKQITSMQWIIKAAIDWERFQAGE